MLNTKKPHSMSSVIISSVVLLNVVAPHQLVRPSSSDHRAILLEATSSQNLCAN